MPIILEKRHTFPLPPLSGLQFLLSIFSFPLMNSLHKRRKEKSSQCPLVLLSCVCTYYGTTHITEFTALLSKHCSMHPHSFSSSQTGTLNPILPQFLVTHSTFWLCCGYPGFSGEPGSWHIPNSRHFPRQWDISSNSPCFLTSSPAPSRPTKACEKRETHRQTLQKG